MRNETYLSDWLAGTLSDEELIELVGKAEFLHYQRLRNALDGFSISHPDMEQNFRTIRQKKETAKPAQARSFPLWRYAAIAAAVLIFFGLFQIFYFSNATETGFGSTQMIMLPDGSKVTVNAKSKLSYPNLFQYNRTLKLDGEAFFEVEKGSVFTVRTELGCVTVLGTKFNVNVHDGYFEVVCYEGKVRVESKGKIAIVTPSERIRFYGSTSENWADKTLAKPSWINGETTLKAVPMQYVFREFTKQYNLKVAFPEKVKNVKFTGTFTNKNKITALKSICVPLGLKFSDDGSGTITISE